MAQAEVVVTSKTAESASYPILDVSGNSCIARANKRDILSLQPNTELDCGAVEVFIQKAAAEMRSRTGADVRVLPPLVFRQWLEFFEKTPENQVKIGLPRLMVRSVLESADFVLIPWGRFYHWSLLVLCHPGVPRPWHDISPPTTTPPVIRSDLKVD